MKRTSTQLPTMQTTKSKGTQPSVGKSTIAFLRQFARAYQYRPQMQPALSEFMAN